MEEYPFDHLIYDNDHISAYEQAMDIYDFDQAKSLIFERLAKENQLEFSLHNSHNFNLFQNASRAKPTFAQTFTLDDGTTHTIELLPYVWSWYERLYFIYQATNDIENQLLALELLLFSHHIKYYMDYKQLLKTHNLWESEFPKFLEKLRTIDFAYYISLLQEEQKIDRLAEEIKKGYIPLLRYGIATIPKHRAELLPQFVAALKDKMIWANTSDIYETICEHIYDLYEIGETESSQELIHYCKTHYNRKKLFIEEIKKIENDIEKLISISKKSK